METRTRVPIRGGPLQPQTLLPALLDRLLEVDDTSYVQIMVNSPFGIIPAHAQEDSTAAWWHSEQCHALMSSVIEALNECAPEGQYFGPREDGGAEYGYYTRR